MGNECYVGSTLKTLEERFKSHKSQMDTTSRILLKKYGVNSCNIVLIKEYDVVDRKHLEAYEQLWINKLKPVNKHQIITLKLLSCTDWWLCGFEKDTIHDIYDSRVIKINCECGVTITQRSLCGHIKSSKHLKYIRERDNPTKIVRVVNKH